MPSLRLRLVGVTCPAGTVLVMDDLTWRSLDALLTEPVDGTGLVLSEREGVWRVHRGLGGDELVASSPDLSGLLRALGRRRRRHPQRILGSDIPMASGRVDHTCTHDLPAAHGHVPMPLPKSGPDRPLTCMYCQGAGVIAHLGGPDTTHATSGHPCPECDQTGRMSTAGPLMLVTDEGVSIRELDVDALARTMPDLVTAGCRHLHTRSARDGASALYEVHLNLPLLVETMAGEGPWLVWDGQGVTDAQSLFGPLVVHSQMVHASSWNLPSVAALRAMTRQAMAEVSATGPFFLSRPLDLPAYHAQLVDLLSHVDLIPAYALVECGCEDCTDVQAGVLALNPDDSVDGELGSASSWQVACAAALDVVLDLSDLNHGSS